MNSGRWILLPRALLKPQQLPCPDPGLPGGEAYLPKMAKLYFYYSAMNAGKTTTLLQSSYNYRERGQARKGFSDRMNGLFNSYCNLTGPLFDPKYRAPKDSGNIVIPNLSEVPLLLLEAHVAGLRAKADSEAGQPEDSHRPEHAGKAFRKFAGEFNRLQEGCREAAFLGQRVQTAN